MKKKVVFDNEFQVFIKPVGSACNLSCSYCYYLEKSKLDVKNQNSIITDDLLENYIRQHLNLCSEEQVLFSWHGGEPSLAGLDFFKKAVNMQKKLNHKGIKIINGIQTNGTKINSEWCDFLTTENFFVGISLDGPEHLHNKHRTSKNGRGSFHQAYHAYKLLKKYGITTEILCVVNAHNVMFPSEVYSFFQSIESQFISFLPLVNKMDGINSGMHPDSVNAEAFGDFLIHVFNEWLENDIGKIKIQNFEEAFRAAFQLEHTLCIFKKNCGAVLVLERNGDVYSCDHYVDKEHYLGNIRKTHLSEMLTGTKQLHFGLAKSMNLPAYCLKCSFLDMCNGECPKNRFLLSPDGEKGLNYLCPGYKKFFRHCTPFIEAIAKVWNQTYI